MSSFNPKSAVAVTGIGMICPLGTNTAECWQNLLAGKSGIRRITKFDASGCGTQIGGQLPESYFSLEKEKTPKRLFRRTVQSTRIIRLCAQEAIADSALDCENLELERCGVIFGTTGSSVRSPDDLGDSRAQRFKIIREMINALPAWVSLENGFKGPTFTVSAACASGSFAISTAYDLIKCGAIDVAVTGGVDYLLTENNIKRGNFGRVLSQRNDVPEKAMRPFDKYRDGWVLADGGCAVVLESSQHAKARGARIYAWVEGYGKTSESYSLFSPSPYGEGMVRTIESALSKSNIPKEKIGYVNANASSTIINDICETAALKKVFGERAYSLPISSTKSMIGHTMGASGAIEFAATALTLETQKIPPTINYQFKDPDCDLNYVPNKMVRVNHLQAALSNSFGFGGHNCVIALSNPLL